MPGAGVSELARGDVELGVRHRRHRAPRRPGEERSDARALGRSAEFRQGPDGATKLSHRDCRFEVVADDVSDEDRETAAAELEGVVPVATDLVRDRAGTIGGRERCSFRLRELTSEQPELEGSRGVLLALEQAGVVDRKCDVVGELAQPFRTQRAFAVAGVRRAASDAVGGARAHGTGRGQL